MVAMGCVFFFQAEDGIRDGHVTGVQTCALPICSDWGGGKLNAMTVSLQPLDPSSSAELISNLIGGTGLPTEVSERLAEAAGGNPLFVEQMLSMLIDDGRLVRQDGG